MIEDAAASDFHKLRLGHQDYIIGRMVLASLVALSNQPNPAVSDLTDVLGLIIHLLFAEYFNSA